jgi:EAL domain-containing protein (putative c-di-GMP-specific phosphodiesterase class I)/GGDEF domain-containing protein
VSVDSLIQALPDLVVGVRRDGVILAVSGGSAVADLKPPVGSIGKHVSAVWSPAIGQLLTQLTRKAIATRTTTEAQFQDGGRHYEVRASAQGPDRAICVLRTPSTDSQIDPSEDTVERLGPQVDRRGFLRRFKESTSMAALREKPMAVAVIHLDGIPDIAQVIAHKVAEQIMTAAILRLSASQFETSASQPRWYLGQLSDSLLALVLESANREAIERCVGQVCDSLREPIAVAGEVFQLTPAAGAAILGEDAVSPRALLDHARASANEARRGGGQRVCFFSDSLRVKSLARLDMAHELREAIASREIGLRYVSRHDLATGRLVAWVGYLRWLHPLRGEIRPAEFLHIAETTGQGVTLSRAAMRWLQEDYATLSEKWGPEVRISFGALRHHLSHEDFVPDFERFLADAAIPAGRLELRIAERNLTVRQPGDFKPLAAAGIQLIVDEVGRSAASLDWLARAPIRAMQLDRAWVVASRKNEIALKVCRAITAIATGLDLVPIATGIDDVEQRTLLASLGCQQGTGDLYLKSALDIIPPVSSRKSG